jgi:hypothetical protein
VRLIAQGKISARQRRNAYSGRVDSGVKGMKRLNFYTPHGLSRRILRAGTYFYHNRMFGHYYASPLFIIKSAAVGGTPASRYDIVRMQCGLPCFSNRHRENGKSQIRSVREQHALYKTMRWYLY